MSKQFFLPTHQEPRYKVRMIPAGVSNCFPPLPAAKLAFVVNTGLYVIFMPSHLQSGLIRFWLASFPGSYVEEEEKEPGTHC